MIGSVTRLAQAAERIIDDLGLDGDPDDDRTGQPVASPRPGATRPRTRSEQLARFSSAPTVARITSSDFLMDGGATASYFHGKLAPQWPVGLTAFSSAPI